MFIYVFFKINNRNYLHLVLKANLFNYLHIINIILNIKIVNITMLTWQQTEKIKRIDKKK